MRELISQYRALALAIVMVALPIFTLASHSGRGQPNLVERWSARGLGLLQSQADGAFGSIADVWERYIDLVDVKAENERLRHDNALLRDENTRLQGILQENVRLRRQVGFRDNHANLELVAARVIAADVNPYFRVLNIRLDIGADQVSPGMPVVSAEGVVGQIEEVTGSVSKVLLATDPRSSIDILTQSNRARGAVRGLNRPQDYLAEIAFLLRRDEVEVGDLVVTSGRGGRFPKELLVGRVRSINKQDFGLYQEAEIEPAVDFSRLEEVYVVVTRSAASSDEDEL